MKRPLFVDRSPILHDLSTKSRVFVDEVIKIVKYNSNTLQALPGVVPVCFLKNWTKAEEQEKLSASAIS